jgi:hypothetical protein
MKTSKLLFNFILLTGLTLSLLSIPLIILAALPPAVPVAKLTDSDGPGDIFGYGIAVSGDTVVVGAPLEDIGASANQGSAYVFVKPGSGWSSTFTYTAWLANSDGITSDELGYSVAISGDIVVAGAPGQAVENNPGSAYIFVKPTGGWGGALTETAILTPSDSTASNAFGFSVAISGDTVIVGAPGNDAAYIFVKPTGGWSGTLTETAKLTATDGPGGEFGYSVSISGDTAAVSAWRHEAAYVFVKPTGGWSGALTETATLIASGGVITNQFGNSVSVSQDTIVVGGPLNENSRGAAYVFVQPGGGWSGTLVEAARLTAADRAIGDYFGISVAINNDTIVVGAYGDDVGSNIDQGSAYTFLKPGAGWSTTSTFASKLIAFDGGPGDQYGYPVAIDNDTAVVADYPRDAAYIFISGNPIYLPLIVKSTP